MNRFFSAALLSTVALAATPASRADTAATPATLPASILVTGENGKAQTLEAGALDRLPQHAVHGEAHGQAVDCSGPNLIDVLALVGTPMGEPLRGKNLALYARVNAADGYRVVFALAELDPGFRDNVPVLVHQCNGKPLDAKDGPFRIVAPAEKRPARWVRQVTAIDVLRAP